MQEKLNSQKQPILSKRFLNDKSTVDPLKEKKIQVLEDEVSELRKKIIEKDRDLERIQTETSLSKVKTKTSRTR